MITIETIEVSGFKGAIKGMRNAWESWAKSDSHACDRAMCCDCTAKTCISFHIGAEDMKLCKKLIKAGTDHRKFLRMIHVQADVIAPAFFMSEFDAYKVGVTRNSSSFMHNGISKPFEIEDFSVSDEIKTILSSKNKIKAIEEILYPYETTEYKEYACDNGRVYEIYKNGKVFAKEFLYIDSYGTGRTRHFDRTECKPSRTRQGYWELNLGGRNRERWLLHRLVAFVWCDNPNNFETVDHINGNKNDNSVENLEWVSRVENIKRGFENGLMRKDNMRANYLNWKSSSKILPDVRYKIRQEHEKGKSQLELSREFNVSNGQISVICKGTSQCENTELYENCWYWENILKQLNQLRELYIESKEKHYFTLIRELLPMGYLYVSTIDVNYETLMRMYHARKNHKLSEWHDMCDWIETLPYMKEFLSE